MKYLYIRTIPFYIAYVISLILYKNNNLDIYLFCLLLSSISLIYIIILWIKKILSQPLKTSHKIAQITLLIIFPVIFIPVKIISDISNEIELYNKTKLNHKPNY